MYISTYQKICQQFFLIFLCRFWVLKILKFKPPLSVKDRCAASLFAQQTAPQKCGAKFATANFSAAAYAIDLLTTIV